MVGTDPNAGSATTTVPAEIVPLRLVFASDGSVLSDDGMAADVASSFVFQPGNFAPGHTQWADAYQRASFWPLVSTISPGYHVLLGQPAILPTQTLRVPRTMGATRFVPAASRRFGLVDELWLDQQLEALLASLHVDPRTLPIFLTDNVDTVETGHDIRTCLDVGGCPGEAAFHAATVAANPVPDGRPNPALGAQHGQPLQTYIYADAADPGDLLPPGLDLRPAALSHEVIEWMDDPIILQRESHATGLFNALFGSGAPPWTSPFHPQCTISLEVADPVSPGPLAGVPDGSGRVELLSDAAFLSWFALERPSRAIFGLYDILGVLGDVSTPC
jgi:hypothetical protein